MLVDQHLHLERGPYTPENYPDSWLDLYLERAATAGVARLGVVEHGYRFLEARGLLPGAWAEDRCRYRLDAYLGFVERVRQRRLPVSCGIEMDYIAGAEEEIRRFLTRYPWDFVLGSVHFVDGVGVDLEADAQLRRQMGQETLWRRYFALSRAAIASGLFDVLTHPDLPKIFGERPPFALDTEYRLTAQALAAADMAIECNTAGLRKPVGDIYPHRAYLRAACAAGVPVSLGSDAHEPRDVGAGFDAAVDLLLESGYREAVHYIGRRRIASSLGSGRQSRGERGEAHPPTA